MTKDFQISTAIKRIFIILLALSMLNSCADSTDNGKTYNASYIISPIPGEKDFRQLTDHEKEISKIFDNTSEADTGAKNSEQIQEKTFLQNRGRIFLSAYKNDQPVKIDTVFSTGLPAPCSCLVEDDTLLINMGIGFFGGMAFHITVTPNQFQSIYYTYTDAGQPYKANRADSFSNELSIKNKYQFLVLDKKPSFKEAQQLTGYLTFTSGTYYENTYGQEVDTAYVSGKIYFTCRTMKKLPRIQAN